MSAVELALIAAGIVAVLFAVARSLPSRRRLIHAVSWTGLALFGWLLAFGLPPPWRVILAGASGVFYAVMTLSHGANRVWAKAVLRSRDPWVLRPAAENEFAIADALLQELRKVLKVQERLVDGRGGSKELERLRSSDARLSAMSPPTDQWQSIVDEARRQIRLVRVFHGAMPPPDGEPVREDDVITGWHDLMAHLHALRHDEASEDRPVGLGLGRQ